MVDSRNFDTLRKAITAIIPDELVVTGIHPLMTGFSNETYLVEGPDLILRLPPSAGAMLDGHGVVAQAQIYEALGQAKGAPPVPEIIGYCDNPEVYSDPFFLMKRVTGEAVSDVNLQSWFTEASDAFRADLCEKWIAAFAKLANLEPLAVLGDAVSPEDDARQWREFASDADCPKLVGYYDRLLEVAAPLSGPPAIVHGDTKLSKIMWKDGEIAAVLDFEMALNGEPLSDLGYVLYNFDSVYHRAARAQKLGGMMQRDEVIALWSRITGRAVDGLIWHEAAQMAKLSAIIAEGANMFNTGRSADPKLSFFAKNLDYYLGVTEAMLDGPEFHALKG